MDWPPAKLKEKWAPSTKWIATVVTERKKKSYVSIFENERWGGVLWKIEGFFVTRCSKMVWTSVHFSVPNCKKKEQYVLLIVPNVLRLAEVW